jgi:predicted nucleic acid-binding protein
MNSLDTNILIYAANSAAPEHAKALALVNEMLANPSEWIIADQVLWEFYKALRHPKILQKPRSAAQASAQVRFMREQSGVACCTCETGHFDDIITQLEKPSFPYQRTHDTVLATTLRRQGVKVLYTRNIKDFAEAGLPKLINPIDESALRA